MLETSILMQKPAAGLFWPLLYPTSTTPTKFLLSKKGRIRLSYPVTENPWTENGLDPAQYLTTSRLMEKKNSMPYI